MNDTAAKDMAHALKTKANAENRSCRFHKDAPADAEVTRVLGTPRARGKNDVIGSKFEQLLPRELIVANHNWRRACDLAHKLIEVVSERIVVVDDQGLHCKTLVGCGKSLEERRNALLSQEGSATRQGSREGRFPRQTL